MKKVFSRTDEVIAKWLSQTQSEGRLGRVNRIFFEGDNLYSYGKHYQIAKLILKEKALLVNCEKCSNTTNKQRNEVIRHFIHLRGCSQMIQWFWVKDFENIYDENGENVEYFRDEINFLLRKTLRAKKYTMIYLKRLENWLNECNRYIDTFKISMEHFNAEKIITDKIRVKVAREKLVGGLK